MQVFKDRFKDKNAIVSGGASGIGRAIVERMVAEGGKVCIIDVNPDTMAEVQGELGEDDVMTVEADVSDRDQVYAAVDAAVERFGHIDTVLTPAAITYRMPFLEIEQEGFDRVMAVNVRGTLNVIQAVAKHMIDKGIKGTVVTFASQDAHICAPSNPTYSISKGAIVSMTRSLGVSLIPYGIRVNCLAPGFTETPFTAPTIADPEKLKLFTADIPIKRTAQAWEQAAPALFLASDDSSYMVGEEMIVDGGNVLHH